MNDAEKLRVVEIEAKLLERADEVFRTAWREAPLGADGIKVGLKALVDAGLLIDLSAYPIRVIQAFGDEDGVRRDPDE
ncbi:hypothetical protein KNU02_gp09 [Gordonia phage Pleakley]|uniref:Uncharacterized protein n=1 Tax=Gordonia phage Pleakley TaxID=2283246 RepID=A0A345M6C7_9CAUD|nr:hypothetical protein KNU02_gp09 [Gordonia phage Pleakley]AXH49735.1 hypothetical protein SEA_FURY_9 [Gordonia phage Fury]AXH66048.1 hypothetical protein SEA_PLEAKLEY_9 [Gordonia phage Pleakley]